MIAYELDVRSEKVAPKRYKVESRAIIGKAGGCTICLIGENIAPQHLLIRENNEVLTVTNLTNLPASLNGQNLLKGKTYILDKSDEIALGEWQIIVRRLKVDATQTEGGQEDAPDFTQTPAPTPTAEAAAAAAEAAATVAFDAAATSVAAAPTTQSTPGEIELDLGNSAGLGLEGSPAGTPAPDAPAAGAPAPENTTAALATSETAADAPEASAESGHNTILKQATRCMRKFLFFISKKDSTGSQTKEKEEPAAPTPSIQFSRDNVSNEATQIKSSTRQSSIEVLNDSPQNLAVESGGGNNPDPENQTLLQKFTSIFKRGKSERKSILDDGPILGGHRKETTSLLSRLIPGRKVKAATEETPAPVKKKVSHMVRPPQEVGILARIYTLLFDFLLCFGLLTCIIPYTTWQASIDKFTNPVVKMVDEKHIAQTWGVLATPLKKIGVGQSLLTSADNFFKDPPPKFVAWAQSIVKVYVPWMLLSIFFAALFGVSLGMFLGGIKCRGSLVGARLRGIVRTVIGFMTMPFFFLFDFPIIVRRRTFKEVITGTNLIYRSNMLRSTGLTVLLPVMLLASFIYLPLFSDFTRSWNITSVGTTTIEPQVRGRNIEVNSPWGQMQGKVSTPWYGIPHIIYHGQQAVVAIDFYAPKEQNETHFQLESVPLGDLRQILAPLIEKNPTSDLLFPMLTEILSHPDKVDWNTKAKGEASTVIRCAWETHPPLLRQLGKVEFKEFNIVDRLINCGVIYHGLAKIRDNIAEALFINSNTPVVASFPQWANRGEENKVLQLSINAIPAEDYFLLPAISHPPVWHITSKSTSRQAAQETMAAFFSSLNFDKKISTENAAAQLLELSTDKLDGIRIADFLYLTITAKNKEKFIKALPTTIPWWKENITHLIDEIKENIDELNERDDLKHLAKILNNTARFYEKSAPEFAKALQGLAKAAFAN